MAQFSDMILTNAGRSLIARTLTGKPLKFTRAIAGDGVLPGFETIPDPDKDEERDEYLRYADTVAGMTQVVHPIREMEIRGIEVPPLIGTAKIKALLSNQDFALGFFFNEIGLFAQDPDTEEDVLYGYCSAGDKGDFMPGQDGSNAVKYYFNLAVVIGQAKKVTAIFSNDPASVTAPELDERIDSVLKHFQTREELLQYQIDCLAEASIKNSLERAESSSS